MQVVAVGRQVLPLPYSPGITFSSITSLATRPPVATESLLSMWLALTSSCFGSCLWGSRAEIFREPKLEFQQGVNLSIYSFEGQAGGSAHSHTRLKVENNWCSSPVLVWIIVLSIC